MWITGNCAYRAEALARVGAFDERFAYGYDNDMSYRLAAAGYRLVFCRTARAVHRWRPDLLGYLRQQFGVGFGRLQLVAKHPGRIGGDQVSGPGMILHAAGALAALLLLLLAPALALAGGPWRVPAAAGAALLVVLGVERTVAGLRAWRAFRDPAALAFPIVHLLRDASWAGAIVAFGARRNRAKGGA